MKKFVALVLAALLLCSSALADVYSFGDFNLDIDPDMPGMLGEKADDEVYLYLYPNYSEADQFHANINVVWQEAVEDLSTIDPAEFGESILSSAISALAASSIDASNPTLLTADYISMSDLVALAGLYTIDCDFSGMGKDFKCTLYYLQAVVSVEGIGSYTFTLTTDKQENLESLVEILDTVTWNF